MKKRFADFVTLQRGFDLPKTDMRDGPFPVVGSTSIIGYHDEYKVEPPGVVTGRSGSLGKVQFLNECYWPHNTSLWVKDFKGNDPRFVYYRLQGFDFARFNAGAGVPTLNRNHLDTLEVDVPPLQVQRRVAGILSAYDELIENTQGRIRILEAMARALYREWFVHFRFPGHETHSRVASPLGDIPKGWEVNPLSRIINVAHGYAFQGSHFSEEPTSRVLTTPGNFQVGGGIKYDKLKYYKEDAPLESAYVFEPMDLMLTMTDLSKAGDTLGYPAFVPRLNGLSFLHNQRVGKVVPTGKSFPKHFLYCLFCDERYRHHIVGGATGTSVKHTSPTRILGYAAAMPNDGKLIHAFENFAQPLFEQIGTLIEALQNLRRTRDLLLPRFLSGEGIHASPYLEATAL